MNRFLTQEMKLQNNTEINTRKGLLYTQIFLYCTHVLRSNHVTRNDGSIDLSKSN